MKHTSAFGANPDPFVADLLQNEEMLITRRGKLLHITRKNPLKFQVRGQRVCNEYPREP